MLSVYSYFTSISTYQYLSDQISRKRHTLIPIEGSEYKQFKTFVNENRYNQKKLASAVSASR